jgi:cytochrome P450
MTLFNAGHDSTAAGLAWVWYLVSRHPEVEARLRAEADAVLGDRPATWEDVPRLSYTEMVVKETMRLYPPTWSLFPRQAIADVELGGYLVRKGGIVNMSPYLLHYDARWFAEPEKFDPERFAPARAEALPACAYLPFGAGPHVCIGNAFALAEMKLIVATVLQRWRLEPAPGQGEVKIEPLVALRPKGGLQLTVRPRPPAAH